MGAHVLICLKIYNNSDISVAFSLFYYVKKCFEVTVYCFIAMLMMFCFIF